MSERVNPKAKEVDRRKRKERRKWTVSLDLSSWPDFIKAILLMLAAGFSLVRAAMEWFTEWLKKSC